MPQYPNQVLAGKNPSNLPCPLNCDADGNLIVGSNPESALSIAVNPDDEPVALKATEDGVLATALDDNGDPAALSLTESGALKVTEVNDFSVTLNITTPTVVKASAGVVGVVTVVVAGSASGTVNNCATTGAAAASNTIWVTDDTAANSEALNFPCTTGIVVVPGTGQTIAISWK